MLALAGSFYVLSTLAFAVMAAVIGVRLLALARRTGGRAERLMGWGVQLTACWGYGVMIVSIIARQALGAVEAPLGQAITGLAWVLHNLGVVCMLVFVVSVFRPEERWARALAGVMAVVLWLGWGLYVADGGLTNGVAQGWYWLAFATIGSYPLWMGAESFLYWGRMRRRLALGLAEPMLVDRFRIWGIASCSTAASIWTVNVPVWIGAPVGSPQASALTAIAMVLTAAFGLVTIGAYWLTFFPPGFYSRRFASARVSAR